MIWNIGWIARHNFIWWISFSEFKHKLELKKVNLIEWNTERIIIVSHLHHSDYVIRYRFWTDIITFQSLELFLSLQFCCKAILKLCHHFQPKHQLYNLRRKNSWNTFNLFSGHQNLFVSPQKKEKKNWMMEERKGEVKEEKDEKVWKVLIYGSDNRIREQCQYMQK